MSPDGSQLYFAEGIAEEIIHGLTRIDGLRVVARTSSFAAKEKGLDVREIGRVLNVGAVLEGSVRTAGPRLRVTAQLIDADNGCHLWSERFDREVSDVFAIQDEITASIVERLRGALHVDERADSRRAPVDPEVYALYLKGQVLLQPAVAGRAAVRAALLHGGERACPDVREGSRGDRQRLGQRSRNLGGLSPTEAWPKARIALERALALDQDLPEALLNAGAMALWYDWDWTAAEACNARCLTLQPGNAYARGGYAWFLLNRRRYDECLQAVREAIALDPLSPLLYSFSVGLHAAMKRPEGALADYARAIELAPTFGLPRFHAAIAHTLLGQYDAAVEALEVGSRYGLPPGWADCILAFARTRQGRSAEAAGIRGRMVRQRSQMSVSPTCIAWVSACLGDYDAAFEWFDRAFDEREGLMAWVHVYTDVFCPALADDPRFGALLERMHLTDVAR